MLFSLAPYRQAGHRPDASLGWSRFERWYSHHSSVEPIDWPSLTLCAADHSREVAIHEGSGTTNAPCSMHHARLSEPDTGRSDNRQPAGEVHFKHFA
jgi:hypothetical protein